MKTIYEWPKKPEVPTFLENVLNNTTEYLLSKKVVYKDSEAIAKELVNYLEQYLYTAYSYHYNFSKIFLSLSSLKYFDIVKTDIPVQTYDPKIVLSSNLLEESKETLRYNLYLGLSKHIISLKNDETLAFSRIFSDSLGEHKVNTNILVNHGWLLLENVLTADMARKFTYYTTGVHPKRTESDEYYYQIASMFGMTLDKVGSIYDYSSAVIMYNLLHKSLNTDLSKSIISEYYQKEYQIELYQILYIMGLLMNEKDKRFPHITLSVTEKEILYKELRNIIFSIATLGEDEYLPTNSIAPQKLNTFEKARILKLIVEKNNQV